MDRLRPRAGALVWLTLLCPLGASAEPAPDPGELQAEEKKGPSCTLETPELPRGGRLEIRTDDAGKAPVVRIGGQVTRMLERTGTTIAVQVPRKSDGGPVTLQVGKARIDCGQLTIVGTD